MKTIQPVTAWYNGQAVQATVLSATCFNDNLLDAASFQYQLMQEIPVPDPNPFPSYLQPVVQGYLNMTGEVYQNWETNDYAYEWVAEQLNLVITGPYVPPAPPTTTSTTTEVPATTTTSTTTTSSK
jgi:hypothetical protein